MASTARELFERVQAEMYEDFAVRDAQREEFFKKQLKEAQEFLEGVKLFVKTGRVNEVLQNEGIEAEQENAGGSKKRGRPKKMSTLAENTTANTGAVKVKKEKISGISEATLGATTLDNIKEIKTEKGDMLAPSWIPPKKKPVRTTRTKGRKGRDSDAIVDNPPIVTVNLSDSEDSSIPARSTRTKTRKPIQGAEGDGELTRSTRTKTRRQKEELQVEEEEAAQEIRSTRTRTIRKAKEPEEAPEETRSTRTKTIRKDKPAEEAVHDVIAKPIRITKSKIVKKQEQTKRNRSDSEGDVEEAANGKEKKKNKSNSPLATPISPTVYEDARSTLGAPQEKPLDATFVADKPAQAPAPVVDKPKYNIFDKKSSDLFTDDESSGEEKTSPKKAPVPKPTQVFSPYEKTTLKKKVEAFEKLQTASQAPLKVGKSGRDTPSSVKEKTKMFTPAAMTFLPTTSSTSKVSRLFKTAASGSGFTPKTAQKNPHEHQRKILEREQALKKKEALLMSQAEAKRTLNESKQLRAQQQRKFLEAEKLKQLEVQKQKEERQKQREQELKLEQENKRLAQKKKFQQVQAQKQLMQEQGNQTKQLPVYMVTQPPQLLSEDCHDSDESDCKTPIPPAWCSSDQLKIAQLTMLASGERIKNTLFWRRPQTPDLTEIFENIDSRKLKRSSSAVWKKPPRYTLLPDLNETKFSEDEELYESD